MVVRMLSDNRVKLVTSTKPNASAVFAGMNGSAPSGGYINPEAMHDPTTGLAIATSDTVPYCAFVDNLFECGIGTIDTAAHTLTRASVVISNSSGTTARIDFSGASTFPTIICSWDAIQGISAYNLNRNGIYGFELQNVSTTVFGASAGCAWIEGLNGAPLAGAAPSNNTPTLGASLHYNVYGFLSSGVWTLEAVSGGAAGSTNPPVPFAVPAGNAKSKTGDTSRRFLGSLLTDGSSHIRPFINSDKGGGIGEIVFLADASGAAPFLVLSGGTSTSYAAVDMSALIPNNGCAIEALLTMQIGGAAGNSVFTSRDGVGFLAFTTGSLTTPPSDTAWWQPINPVTTAALYYKVAGSSPSASIYCWAFRYRR